MDFALAKIELYRSDQVAPPPEELVKPEPGSEPVSPAIEGGSDETRFKRLRRWSANSATVYLRRRRPLAASAMVRCARWSEKFCLALRRPRCPSRHVAPLGGLRSSGSPNGACGGCRAKQGSEAGGQRFSESRLWRPVSAS